jgi:L-threonylcarbamoyladenylate synthase
MKCLSFRSVDDIATAIPHAAAHLQRGGLLAHPTETVYGLGCPPETGAITALSRLKEREEDKPFLLLISGRDMAEAWGLVLNEPARALAEAYWPGPLTLVLATLGDKLPDELRGPGGGIAVRWTSHLGMARLIAEVAHPITSTSANRAGEPPVGDVHALEEAFGGAPDLLALDGGPSDDSPPSTILDCTGSPRLIREGAIPLHDLQSAIGSEAP